MEGRRRPLPAPPAALARLVRADGRGATTSRSRRSDTTRSRRSPHPAARRVLSGLSGRRRAASPTRSTPCAGMPGAPLHETPGRRARRRRSSSATSRCCSPRSRCSGSRTSSSRSAVAESAAIWLLACPRRVLRLRLPRRIAVPLALDRVAARSRSSAGWGWAAILGARRGVHAPRRRPARRAAAYDLVPRPRREPPGRARRAPAARRPRGRRRRALLARARARRSVGVLRGPARIRPRRLSRTSAGIVDLFRIGGQERARARSGTESRSPRSRSRAVCFVRARRARAGGFRSRSRRGPSSRSRSSLLSGHLISMPRYVFAAFPLFIGAALLVPRGRWPAILAAVSVALQVAGIRRVHARVAGARSDARSRRGCYDRRRRWPPTSSSSCCSSRASRRSSSSGSSCARSRRSSTEPRGSRRSSASCRPSACRR